MKMYKLAFLAILALLMIGCSAIETVNQATSVYRGAQNLRQAKDIVQSEPVFQGMEAFRVEAVLHPKNPATTEELEAAFEANLTVKVDEYLREAGLEIASCVNDCPKRSVLIQFRETGWDGLVNRWTFGRKLRGELFFIETEFGAILDRVDVAGGENYADLSKNIIVAAMTRASATMAVEHRSAVERGEMSQADAQKSVRGSMESLNDIDPVHTDYRPYLLAKR